MAAGAAQILGKSQKEGISAMAVHENLAVNYHQQDTDVYCGAACAQMVLNSIGTALLDQVNLITTRETIPASCHLGGIRQMD
jgi:hypothetical protein